MKACKHFKKFAKHKWSEEESEEEQDNGESYLAKKTCYHGFETLNYRQEKVWQMFNAKRGLNIKIKNN